MERAQHQLESTIRGQAGLEGRAVPDPTPRTRPGALSWECEMHRLESIHELELRLPPDAVDAAASRLGVTARSVRGRFGEHARRVARAWDGGFRSAAVASAASSPDFLAASAVLRAHGFDGPSVVIERLLLDAPGPAARALRAREAARRLALTSSPYAVAA